MAGHTDTVHTCQSWDRTRTDPSIRKQRRIRRLTITFLFYCCPIHPQVPSFQVMGNKVPCKIESLKHRGTLWVNLLCFCAVGEPPVLLLTQHKLQKKWAVSPLFQRHCPLQINGFPLIFLPFRAGHLTQGLVCARQVFFLWRTTPAFPYF